MKTPFTEDQKKRLYALSALSAGVGMLLGIFITMMICKKQTDKLEAKIFKLEGWQ